MKKSVAMKWVKALRSGKYAQGQGTLNSDGRYCCLGVLCDISKVGEWAELSNGTKLYVDPDKSTSHAYPTPSVQKWAGLASYRGDHVTKSGEGRTLANYNDGAYLLNGVERPATFNEVADWIERNYKAL